MLVTNMPAVSISVKSILAADMLALKTFLSNTSLTISTFLITKLVIWE